MDNTRALIAISLSLLILLGYQYFFVPPAPVKTSPKPQEVTSAEDVTAPASQNQQPQQLQTMPAVPKGAENITASVPLDGKDVTIETDLFTAVITENGGGIKSFRLKNHKEAIGNDAEDKELVKTTQWQDLPLFFSWGVEPGQFGVPRFFSDQEKVRLFDTEGQGRVSFHTLLPSGLDITRTFFVDNNGYQMKLLVDVMNKTDMPIQGAPFMRLTNRPFTPGSDSYSFTGPVVFRNGVLEETKPDDLAKGPKEVTGDLSWVAYGENYFMCGVIPEKKEGQSARLSLADKDKVSILLTSAADTIPANDHKQYEYIVYFGPKSLDSLKQVGANLERIVDFGWFDVLARPMLSLLKFFYGLTHNYGIAIILVTIIIKLLFWPISQKGIKSMQNMQKLQPKIAKLREKYKDDQERLNRELIGLYKTYKVNPVGGCLPMVVQIPVFFALYKVLLLAIELRHAPFFLWIQDLSAPDRLSIGFSIPYLGGVPVLTLLMGASMFVQQKMTPTTADPTQAKIMLFMPIIFTFMFVNFASGLVLYWFVNNLLAIGQQWLVNRQTAT